MKKITRLTMTVALLLMAVASSWAGIKTSASDIGKVIATNGKVYANAAAATADGAEAVAMIVWFNAAGTEGLAIGYKDVEDYGLLWDDFYTYLDDEIYARGWNKNANKVTGATWITPTAYQWMDALKGCGSTSTKVDPVTDTYPFLLGNLNTMLETAGFGVMPGDQHWTSTTTGGYYVLYNTTSKKFEYHTTSESWYGLGRLFLSFDVENNSLCDATASDLGKVITTAGHIFATVSAATAAGETPVAMIAYVGTTEGLAIELDINGPVTLVTALNALDPPYYPAVTGAGVWHIPSITEWQLMAAAFEGTAYDSAVDPNCGDALNFNKLGATLAAVGGADDFDTKTELWSTTQTTDEYLCPNPSEGWMTCVIPEPDPEVFNYNYFMAVIPFTLTPDPTPQRTVYLAGNDYTKVIVKADDTKKTVEANTGSGADVVSGKAVIGGTATTVTVAPKEGYMFSAINARKDYVIDVKELTVSNLQAEDGMVLTGNTSSNTYIVVPAGATITLRNLDITNLEKGKNTMTFEGDANVILEGTNYVAYGNSQNPTIPAISFAPGSTVKFSGSGTLLAYAYQNKAEGFSDIVSDGVTLDISGLTGSGSVKQQPMFTAPTTKTGLIYDGSNQELVNAGTTSGGTMQYSANGESLWSASLPTGKNAGTYSVYYRIEGSGFYADMVKQKLSPNPVIL